MTEAIPKCLRYFYNQVLAASWIFLLSSATFEKVLDFSLDGHVIKACKIDLLISLKLHDWPALNLAIQNNWGGAASNDKRDWLCGAVSDLFSNGQVVDAQDLEEVLIQVMLDEFEVVVDDDSPAEVANDIVKGRHRLLRGESPGLDEALARWEEKQKKGPQKLAFKKVEAVEDEGEGEGSDCEISSVGEGDTEMDEAPQLVPAVKAEKQEPEVDDEGFTKVAGRKRR